MGTGEACAGRGAFPDLRDLVGTSAAAAIERLGRPTADRRVGPDRWLRFEGRGWSLRARARPRRPGGDARVRSWTVACESGFDTLADALRALGLADAASPPVPGELRLPLRDRDGRLHSLTAAERAGRIHAVSAFDEPPDWASDPSLNPR